MIVVHRMVVVVEEQKAHQHARLDQLADRRVVVAEVRQYLAVVLAEQRRDEIEGLGLRGEPQRARRDDDLVAGAVVDGPALIQQEHSALVVPTGWTVVGLGSGGVRASAPSEGSDVEQPLMRKEASQAVELELMSHRFASIAREMGEVLRRTAISTNVKERLDFSCAIFTRQGDLVVMTPNSRATPEPMAMPSSMASSTMEAMLMLFVVLPAVMVRVPSARVKSVPFA